MHLIQLVVVTLSLSVFFPLQATAATDDARMKERLKALNESIESELEQLRTQSQQTPEEEAKEEQERKEARARMAARTPQAQKEVEKLHKELLSMRGTRNFRELGFSVNNKPATEWKKRMEDTLERFRRDDDIAAEVKIAMTALLNLAMTQKWRMGGTTDSTQFFEEEIWAALEWKLNTDE
jgi:DNA anti-recombination protein RmuC